MASWFLPAFLRDGRSLLTDAFETGYISQLNSYVVGDRNIVPRISCKVITL